MSQRFKITNYEYYSKLILSRYPDFFKAPFDYSQSYVVSKMLCKQLPSDKYNKDALNNLYEIKKMLVKHHHTELVALEDAVTSVRASIRDNLEDCGEHLYTTHTTFNEITGEAEKLTDDILSLLYSQIWDFHNCGKKLFRIEDGLMQELYLTDISKIDSEFLKLPYYSICFHLPYNELFRLFKEKIEWIYIRETNIESPIFSKSIEIFCINAKSQFYANRFAFKEGDLKQQLIEQVEYQFRGSKLAIEENKDIFNFIIATLLYINSNDADLKHVLPSCIFPKKDSKIAVCKVGGNIVINHTFKNMAVNENGEKSEHLIHILKWAVRGHFRKQVCGIKNKDRKTIWIRPFLKGKERLSDIPAKPINSYVVK